MRRKREIGPIEISIEDLVVQADHAHILIFHHQEMVPEATVDRGRLDGVINQRIDVQFAAVDHAFEGRIGEDHTKFPGRLVDGKNAELPRNRLATGNDALGLNRILGGKTGMTEIADGMGPDAGEQAL